MAHKRKKFYQNGIRFECQKAGKCCKFRGSYGYIYFSLKERQRVAAYLGISTVKFTTHYMKKTDGLFHLKQPEKHCPFLKNNRCSVYKARPMQCRTWPFWPENMMEKVWKEEIEPYCPGIGKGRLYSAQEIEEIIRTQKEVTYS